MAAAFDADLFDEFSEAGSVREVDAGAGLHAVPVSAGDQEMAGFLSELEHGAVLAGVAETIQLQGVEGRAGQRQEAKHLVAVGVRANAMKVPDRVIEDDEHARKGMEVGENAAKLVLEGLFGVGGEPGGPGEGAGRGKIVDAEMELSAAEGDGPLERDRDAASAGNGAQELGGGDAVVVGKGDEGHKAKLGDLTGLDRVSHAGDEGRTPVGASEVETDAVVETLPSIVGKDLTERGKGGEQLVNEGKGLKRLTGVAVEGDAAREQSGEFALVPDARDRGLVVRGDGCHREVLRDELRVGGGATMEGEGAENAW